GHEQDRPARPRRLGLAALPGGEPLDAAGPGLVVARRAVGGTLVVGRRRAFVALRPTPLAAAPAFAVRRAAGAARLESFDLLLLLGGEDLVQPLPDFFVQVAELPFLVRRERQ